LGKLDGKVAIITGAARGQGEAEARLFAAEGARVVVADVLEDLARTVAADLGASGLACGLDVSRPEDWDAAIKMTLDRFGRIDVLVNNAGIVRAASIEDMPVEDFLQIIQINQLGCWLGMKAVIPAMRAAGGGSIVNISSQAGLTPGLNISAYAGTKAAMGVMSKVAAGELGPDHIRVNTVYPGAILTDMSFTRNLSDEARAKAYSHLPIPRLGTVEEVAKMVLFLASDDSSYCTGADFVVDGGALAIFRIPQPPKDDQ
jgi:3alpha(or 20beta)-hydroxysteroid dehydrogenase